MDVHALQHLANLAYCNSPPRQTGKRIQNQVVGDIARYAPQGLVLGDRRARLQGRRNIVSVTPIRSAVGEDRAHRPPLGIEDQARKRSLHTTGLLSAFPAQVLRQLRLDRVKHLRRDDGRVSVRVGHLLVSDFAEVDAVLQEVEQSPATEAQAAHRAPAARHPCLGSDALLVQTPLKLVYGAHREVALENHSDGLGFLHVHGQASAS